MWSREGWLAITFAIHQKDAINYIVNLGHWCQVEGLVFECIIQIC